MLQNIFLFCLLLGFSIPLLNLITGWFGGLFGGVCVDVDVDVNVHVSTSASGGGWIPFNFMCLCLFLVVFGATGRATLHLMTNPLFTALFLALSLFLAGLMYWLLYKLLVKRLKESDASAFSYQCLTGRTAEVTLGISGDSMGTISMRDSTGAAITFRAKRDPDLSKWMPDTIERGESVVITGANAEKKLCYVSVSLGEIMKHKMGEA